MTAGQSHILAVDLGERSYDIIIGEGLIAQAGKLIAPLLKRPQLAIVTDDNVAGHYLRPLEKALQSNGIKTTSITLCPGEKTKSYPVLNQLCDDLLAAGVERSDMIVALGGGVIGDITGFAASILRRGVDFIQIPTSLLAQVDSSVGGKTGINSPHGKNLIGAFHQPRLVIADTATLKSLPERELRAGYAEVAKYGLLGDAPFFTWLEQNADAIFSGDPETMITAIGKSCAAKADIVAEDERESGIRALLNLGHTFGHALESATGYSSLLLHGEGVAIGMAMAFRFSQRLDLCTAEDSNRVSAHLTACGLPISARHLVNDLPSPSKLLEIMRQDKKAEAGKLTLILVKGIGDAFISHNVDEDAILNFLSDELN